MVGVVWAQLWPQWEKNNVHHSGGDQQAGSCQASGGLKMGPSQTMLGIRLLFKGKVIREFWPLFLSWFEPIYCMLLTNRLKYFRIIFQLPPRCAWCRVFQLYDRISRRNQNRIRKYFRLFIRGLDGFELWKKCRSKSRETLTLKRDFWPGLLGLWNYYTVVVFFVFPKSTRIFFIQPSPIIDLVPFHI